MTSIAVKEVQNQYGLTEAPNLYDPYQSVCYGILLLDFYYSEARTIKGALILYNGGYIQLAKWRNKEPMAPETAAYVPKVLAYRAKLDRMFDRELSDRDLSSVSAIIDDVWEELYGAGEDDASFLFAGGLGALRDSQDTRGVRCGLDQTGAPLEAMVR